MRRNFKILLLLILLVVFVKVVAGNFHRWKPKRQIHFQSLNLEHIKIYYVPSDHFASNIRRLAKRVQANLDAAEKRLNVKLTGDLHIYLYNDWEEKGLDIEDIRIASTNPAQKIIYCIENKTLDGLKEGREYELLLFQRYGKPFDESAGEYFSAALSGIWNQKTIDEWIRFLSSRELNPDLSNFFSPKSRLSIYWRYPWNSTFVRFVKENYGWDEMIHLYRTGQFPTDYQKRWQHYIEAGKLPSEPPSYVFKPAFQKGITYAFANSPDAGYASRNSQKSLDELKRLGVEWVAAVPYGFMRTAQAETIGYAGHSAYSESDESMFALSQDARARGMKVMLKPQIWIAHDSWPGKIDFDDAQSWNRWFDSYEKWIIHYAILAERIDANLFCIGTEMVQTTLTHPERWRRIIARIRKIYHGPLVYAANYGKEFEELTFWDSLDYIGLDNYYPIRSNSVTLDAMRSGFQQQKQKIEQIVKKYQKPLIFTEAGYMANENAGMGSLEYKASAYDETLQKTCYRLLLETYWDQPWFYGAYWWKWFSDPSDRGRNADPHSPHGRPAQDVLKEWYAKQSPR